MEKLISLNLMDVKSGNTDMTNVNISITPVVDGVEVAENRSSILGSSIQNDVDLNAFISEVKTALDKLILAKGL